MYVNYYHLGYIALENYSKLHIPYNRQLYVCYVISTNAEKSQRIKIKGFDFSTSLRFDRNDLSLITYKQYIVTSTVVERSQQVEKNKRIKFLDFDTYEDLTYNKISNK